MTEDDKKLVADLRRCDGTTDITVLLDRIEDAAARIESLAAKVLDLNDELRQCRKEKNALVLKAYPAMDERDDLLKAASLAFGCLWRDLSGNLLAIDARKHLSAVLSQDAKKRGIEEALGRYGHPDDGETLAAVDRAFPPEYVRAAAGEAKQKERAEASEARVRALEEALTNVRALCPAGDHIMGVGLSAAHGLLLRIDDIAAAALGASNG